MQDVTGVGIDSDLIWWMKEINVRYRGREVSAGMGLIGLSPTKNPNETALKVYPFCTGRPDVLFAVVLSFLVLCLLLIFYHSSILISHLIFNVSVGYISQVPGSCSHYSFSDSAFPSPMFHRKKSVHQHPERPPDNSLQSALYILTDFRIPGHYIPNVLLT